jgi:hypothetical protein
VKEKLTKKDLISSHKEQGSFMKDFGEEYTSVSRVKTFLSCPKKYMFHYKWGINIKRPAKALVFGDLIHKPMEAFYKGLYDDPKPNPALLYVTFDKEFEKQASIIEQIMPKEKDRDVFRAHGLLCLEKFASRMKGVYKSIPVKYKPSHTKNVFVPSTELEAKIPIIDVFSNHGDLVTKKKLLVYIDLVSQNEKFGLVIWDHKTAARTWTTFKKETDIQLPAYAYTFRHLLAEGHFPEIEETQEDRVGYNFIYKTKDPKVQIHTQEIEDWRIKTFFHILRKIDQAIEMDYFPPTLNHESFTACNGCPYAIPEPQSNVFKPKESICYQHMRGAKQADCHNIFNNIKRKNKGLYK